jgi:hypothetical protein
VFGLNEIVASLRGSFELALGRASGLSYFENSIDAFWRSFTVIILVAPIYLIQVLAERSNLFASGLLDPETYSSGLYFFVKTGVLVIDWFAFPILMVGIARLLNLTTRYGIYITVFNWSSLLIVLALTPAFVAWTLGLVGDFLANILTLGILMLVLRFRWFIAQEVLGAPPVTAAGLVLAEFLMSILINQSGNRLIGI